MHRVSMIFTLTLFLLLLTLSSCSLAPFVYGEQKLDEDKVFGARTALVIESEFIHWEDSWKNNSFSFQVTGRIDAESLFEELIIPMDRALGEQFLEDVAEFVFTVMSSPKAPLMGLDTYEYYRSADFPVLFQDEMYKLGGIYRDYSSLAEKGYTHILQIGFDNTYDASSNVLAFGFNGILYDIRNGAGEGEPIEVRAARGAWRLSVNQVPRSVTVAHTYLNPWYGTSYASSSDVYSTTSYSTTATRHCLNVVCVDENGIQLTAEDLFGGENPLYVKVYARAALNYMLLAIDHMKSGRITDVTRLVNINEFVESPLPWEMFHQ